MNARADRPADRSELPSPYSQRNDAEFLRKMVDLTRHHQRACAEYARIWPDWRDADTIEQIPYLHVGLFKQVLLRSLAEGVHHERVLKSSATSGASASAVMLDRESSRLQAASTLAILESFVGPAKRPLLVFDSARSLRTRGEVSARLAAAMSLRPLASEIHFLLEDGHDPRSLRWETLRDVVARHADLLVYGFTWMLWLGWATVEMPSGLRDLLRQKRITFVHSGGWKKLDALAVDHGELDRRLCEGLDPVSKVIDFYGLVEQVGIVYPLCEAGSRHVPVWADVLVRDIHTLRCLTDEVGHLQLLNLLPRGAPYHSVLTDDLGRVVPGDCACRRSGRRFQLLGRAPKVELRGCANV